MKPLIKKAYYSASKRLDTGSEVALFLYDIENGNIFEEVNVWTGLPEWEECSSPNIGRLPVIANYTLIEIPIGTLIGIITFTSLEKFCK